MSAAMDWPSAGVSTAYDRLFKVKEPRGAGTMKRSVSASASETREWT